MRISNAVAACVLSAVVGGAVVGGAVVSAQSPAPAAKAALQSSWVYTWDAIQATNPGGKRWQLVDAPTPTLDKLEIHVTELAAGQASHAPHRHADEEVIVIRQGNFEVFQDGKLTQAGPGSIIFYHSQSLHGLKNVGTTTGNYHVIRWTSPGASGR